MQKFRALLCGFEPFGQYTINPSWIAVKAIPEEIGCAEIVKQQLPVSFRLAHQELEKAIEKEQPDIILCTGMAADRKEITIERVAINICDARIPDNEGLQPLDLPVLPGAPDAYFSNLPIKEIIKSISQAGIKASISNTAGTFVCNHVMFHLMHNIVTQKNNILGGFIHLPSLPEMIDAGSERSGMPLESMVTGLSHAISVCASILEKRIDGNSLPTL